VVVVATGDAGNRRGEADLTAYAEFYRFDERAAGIAVGGQGNRVVTGVDVAPVGVEQVHFVRAGEGGDDAVVIVLTGVGLETAKDLADVFFEVVRDGVALDDGDRAVTNGVYFFQDVTAQVAYVNETYGAVFQDFGGLAVGEFVGEGGDEGVVVGAAERTVDVGNDKTGEAAAAAQGPRFEQYTSLALATAVLVVAFFLSAGAEQDMGGDLFFFHGLDELTNETEIGLVEDFGVGMTVHRGQVDDDVALFYVSTETGFVLEVIVLERDAAVLAGIEAQGMVKVAADEAGLAGDSYGEHFFGG